MRISQHGVSRHRSAPSRALAWIFVIMAGFLAVAIWIDYSIRPVVSEVIEYQAKVFASRLINDAMMEELERAGLEYDNLVKISRDENGEVTSIEADMVQINRLKSRMGSSVVKKLEETDNREIFVPIGTILGNQFTSGRGPDIGIRIVPTGYAQTEIFNQFTSAGINQTHHQLMLNVSVQVVAILTGYSVKTDTQTSFCIAETVIVGDIPNGYASINGSATAFAPFEDKVAGIK